MPVMSAEVQVAWDELDQVRLSKPIRTKGRAISSGALVTCVLGQEKAGDFELQ